jgi:oligopeptide transport system substrate-binding protein
MAPFRDPIMHLRVFVTGDPNNVSRFTNAEYDLLVAEIEELSPGPEREAKLFRAQKILLEEQAVVVPIYHYVQNHAVSARVKNFQVNPFGEIRFAGLDVTGD